MTMAKTDRPEESVQADVIDSLVKETHQPLPVVKRVFEAEYSRLKARARITDYLMLFASRHTRDVLKHMHG